MAVYPDWHRPPTFSIETKKRRAAALLPWIIILTAAALAFLAGRATAAEAKPLTVAQALSMLQAMRGLDGRAVTVKQNGQDAVVVQPWDFGSGSLRLRVAKNTAALSEVEQQLENTRHSIVLEILRKIPNARDGAPLTEIPQGTPEWSELQRQYGEALQAPVSVTLSRIRASELKLDKNEIPVTALAALAPILDDDISEPAK